MGKSVTDYYAEKMQKLLEAQKQSTKQGPVLSAAAAKKPTPPGREYYNKFRREGAAGNTVKPKAPLQGQRAMGGTAPRPQSGTSYAPPRYAPPRATAQSTERRKQGAGQPPKSGGAPNSKGKAKTPEQTLADRRREEEARNEAIEKARRARRLRKVRDALISFVLIVAVFGAMCVAVYRLLFIVSDVGAEGSDVYAPEQIVAASGVDEGDHLYSFRASVVSSLIKHRCPQITDVSITRRIPSTVTFNVTEEECRYYTDFYGEYRGISASMRVLFSISADEAKRRGLVLMKLPPVRSAIAGERAEFATIKNDSYIYDVVSAVAESELSDRINTIDLQSKYDVRLVCDGKYLMMLGTSESVETKLRIAKSVLEDEMFNSEDKARIDLSDLSKTSVVVDNQLVLD